MVNILSALEFLNIQPDLMHQMNVFRLHGWCMGTNAIALNCGVGAYHHKDELPLRLRHGLPGLAQAEGLFFSRHLAGEPGHHGGAFQRIGSLDNGRPDVARRYNKQGNLFAAIFRYGNRFGEQSLLVVAENLFHGHVVVRTAIAG